MILELLISTAKAPILWKKAPNTGVISPKADRMIIVKLMRTDITRF